MANSEKLLIIDVDGTLTDGGIYYDENGNELKKFCTTDAAGFFAAHQVGYKIMILTGRNVLLRKEECQSYMWIIFSRTYEIKKNI